MLAVLPFAATSRAEVLTPQRVTREPACEVIDYGNYVPGATRVRYADARSVTGDRFEIEEVRFTKRTTQIPRELGQRFGIRYRLRGLTQTSVTVTWRVTFPSKVRGSPGWEYSFRASPAAGELMQHVLYDFVIASEMVAGRWDFQVLVNGQAACGFAFTVK